MQKCCKNTLADRINVDSKVMINYKLQFTRVDK